MGGVPINVETEVLRANDEVVPGLYATGEVACVSVHGSNRLGTNSLLDINVFGRRAGIAAAEHARRVELPDLPAGAESTMDRNAQVFRTEESLVEVQADIVKLKERYGDIAISDKGKRYNSDLLEAVELGFLLDLAEVLVVSARNRKESRGGHAREDYLERDDQNYMKHTMAYRQPDGSIRLDWKPATQTRYQPMAGNIDRFPSLARRAGMHHVLPGVLDRRLVLRAGRDRQRAPVHLRLPRPGRRGTAGDPQRP
jgi:succinate dehydrogenase / fumarate reductase flavoprotein subunit